MRSNFAPRLGVRARVGVRRARAPRPPRPARGDRAPARPVRRGRGALGHLGAAHRARSTTRSRAEGRRVVEEEDPDLLVLQLLAADQLGHVRGVRNPRVPRPDRGDRPPRRRTSSRFLDERGKLDDATVILMADHGQGRGIGGHGHLDWGERPVPFVVWGAGARARRGQPRAALGLRAGADRLRAARRGGPGGGAGPADGARARPLRRAGRLGRPRARRRGGPRRGAGRSAACSPGCRRAACGMPVDVLLVDDGSRDATAATSAASAAREVVSHAALARPRRRAAHRPRARARRGLRRRRLPRRRRRVRPGRLRSACSTRSRAAAPTTCSARASSASARA